MGAADGRLIPAFFHARCEVSHKANQRIKEFQAQASPIVDFAAKTIFHTDRQPSTNAI